MEKQHGGTEVVTAGVCRETAYRAQREKYYDALSKLQCLATCQGNTSFAPCVQTSAEQYYRNGLAKRGLQNY